MARTTTNRTSAKKNRTTAKKPTAIDQAKTPLLAAIGAGDYALSTVLGAVSDARTRAEERAEHTRDRITSIPDEIDELRGKLEPEELRKVAEAYVQAAASIYVSLAERGNDAVGRIRKQPQVEEIVDRVEDARGDAKDLTDEVLGTVARQTRSIGERAARATEMATGRATSLAGKAGAAAAEAGDEAATELRSTSRRAANVASKQGSSTNARTAATKQATAAKKTAAKKTTTARKTATKRASAARTTASSTADTAATTATNVADTASAAQETATERTTSTS